MPRISSFFDGLKLRPDASAGQAELARNGSVADNEKDGATVGERAAANLDFHKDIKTTVDDDSDTEELTHKDMQPGIQKIEGMAQMWPKWALYFTYAWYVLS